MLSGKKRKVNSDPSFSGATKTINNETMICPINRNQVDLTSIFPNKDLFVAGMIEIIATKPIKTRGIK